MIKGKEKLELLTKQLTTLKQAELTLNSLCDKEYTSDLMCSRAAIALSGVIEDIEYEIQSLESQRQRDLEKGFLYRW